MDFLGDIARKRGDSSLLAVEAEKTERAREIGRATGLFRVPRVLNLDEEQGILDFERLDGLTTLLQLAVEKDARLCDLMERTGRALAVVHKELLLPDGMKHELPPEWMECTDDNVFIHGDFGGENVCYSNSSDRLVLLDWSAAPLIGRVPTYGSRYFDISWFTGYMFRRAPTRNLFRWNPEMMMCSFVNGYAQEAGIEALADFRAYMPAMRRLQKCSIRYLTSQKSIVRAAVYALFQISMYIRFRRFLSRCCLQN